MTSGKGRQLDKNAKCRPKKNTSFNNNDEEKKGPWICLCFHILFMWIVEDQKSGLKVKTVCLRRGIAYEPKQTMSHPLSTFQNKPCVALTFCLF